MSALDGSEVNPYPPWLNAVNISSVSTRFLSHPKEINPIFLSLKFTLIICYSSLFDSSRESLFENLFSNSSRVIKILRLPLIVSDNGFNGSAAPVTRIAA